MKNSRGCRYFLAFLTQEGATEGDAGVWAGLGAPSMAAPSNTRVRVGQLCDLQERFRWE